MWGPQKVNGKHQGIEALRRLRAQHACSIQSGAHHFKRNALDQSINQMVQTFIIELGASVIVQWRRNSSRK